MCVGTFLKNNPRNVDLFINKKGLSGKFRVQLLVDENIYETGVSLEF